jgi:hypothetical protein
MPEPCWRYVHQDTGDGLCLRCGVHEFDHPDVRAKAKKVTDVWFAEMWRGSIGAIAPGTIVAVSNEIYRWDGESLSAIEITRLRETSNGSRRP